MWVILFKEGIGMYEVRQIRKLKDNSLAGYLQSNDLAVATFPAKEKKDYILI